MYVSALTRGTVPASVLGIFIALATSCAASRELSRSRALALLKESKDFRSPVSLLMASERALPVEAQSMSEPAAMAEARAIESFLNSHPQVAVFRHLGLVDVRTSVVQRAEPDHLWWKFDVEPFLTEKGKELAAREHAPEQAIPIARNEVIEVTGIRKVGESSAEVEFTYKDVPTEVGKVFDPQSAAYRSLPASLQEAITMPRGMMGRDATRKFGEVYTGAASFQLYDDGWRVQAFR